MSSSTGNVGTRESCPFPYGKQVEWPSVVGTTYYVQVTGVSSLDAGPFTLDVIGTNQQLVESTGEAT